MWTIFKVFIKFVTILLLFGGGVQSLSPVPLFETSWITAGQTSLSFTISWSLLKLMSIELVLLLFYVLFFWPRGMWDLRSPTRDRICTPYIGR